MLGKLMDFDPDNSLVRRFFNWLADTQERYEREKYPNE
jgi:hypothetical protein